MHLSFEPNIFFHFLLYFFRICVFHVDCYFCRKVRSFSTNYLLLCDISCHPNLLLLYTILNPFEPPYINSFFVTLVTESCRKILNLIMLYLFDFFGVRYINEIFIMI